ncbi:RpiR family transcriptional regulator [Acidovorax temperans]|jgi:DNA-binding MurR/RpiR family transcriptional regulator|uniref:RpiR family transcriptional regulator n=1 Tax=Acidovorax temperans TaxID=80878 RepID=A0A543LLI3_9BURK|nr:MurR/RpiR family transcriptional regulator [Acidovorax temperans]TQN08259.1 RpiR family transcriptional regulator [Acidovorax temperans]HRL55490.1 MurR/RpiR family transcriptional regulator [Acidovorax temperans]HRM64812.1 MurR/RpiR family transcriptional regulator [Acidovorax temperans]HRM83279.1 MurR/RpiR family transcriptional regulator [Acidovorax temperans]
MKSSLQTSAGLLTERLARHHADLTGSERALAEALQRDYPHALLESATALAARNGTSASTVVRLFAKLGYASYAEAQREARAEVTALLQTAGQRAPVTIGAERTLQQCVDDALLHDQHNLSATREGLNLAAFEAMATCLAQDKGRVHVLAQINSAPVGSWLALHLNMCRPGVQELGAGAMDTTDQLLWVQPDDVLLVFSIRRYASGPAKVAQHFRDAGAQVLAITDSPAAPVATLAHHHLQVHTSNASPFDSYTAAFFLCNALVSAVAQLRHGAVPQVLARRDSLWDQFESQRLLDPPASRSAGTRRKPADKK